MFITFSYIPYISILSHHIKNKLSKLSKEFCKKHLNIKLIFSSFKIKSYFSYKDPILNDLKSFLVYKFTCASCGSSSIGETCHHFKTRTEEHIKKDNKSHIFKHLYSTAICFDSYNPLCFEIIDKANSKFDLEIKEALHINWRKPNLNVQQNHLAPTLSLKLLFPLLLSVAVCFSFVVCLQFFFIHCFHYLYTIYEHPLLS